MNNCARKRGPLWSSDKTKFLHIAVVQNSILFIECDRNFPEILEKDIIIYTHQNFGPFLGQLASYEVVCTQAHGYCCLCHASSVICFSMRPTTGPKAFKNHFVFWRTWDQAHCRPFSALGNPNKDCTERGICFFSRNKRKLFWRGVASRPYRWVILPCHSPFVGDAQGSWSCLLGTWATTVLSTVEELCTRVRYDTLRSGKWPFASR